MTPEQLAARWLADVPRLWLGAANSDNECEVWFDPDEGGTEYVQTDATLAAIARHLAPGDDAVLIDALLNEPGFDKEWREAAAARLSALTAQVAELTRERDEAREDAAKFGGMKVASDHEAATLRARLARMEGERDDALTFLDNAVSKSPQPLKDLGAYLASLLDEDDWPQAERYLNAAVKSCAALTDGGSNEG